MTLRAIDAGNYEVIDADLVAANKKRVGGWRREAHRLVLEGNVPVVLPADDVVKRVEERVRTFLRGRSRIVSRAEILGSEPVSPQEA